MTGDVLRTVAGVDGCKAGWIAVIRRPQDVLEICLNKSFRVLIDALPGDSVLAVDMPIGLPDRIGPAGRGPEALVRAVLGKRRSSVFSIPARGAVYAGDADFSKLDRWHDAHREASTMARRTSDPPRGVSIQAFGIFAKIREVDALLRETPRLHGRIIESHPELAFWQLNGGQPMAAAKKSGGRVNEVAMRERMDVLARHGMAPETFERKPPRGAGMDDLLDAAALCLVAARFAAGRAISFPSPPSVDSHGIPIAIWC